MDLSVPLTRKNKLFAALIYTVGHKGGRIISTPIYGTILDNDLFLIDLDNSIHSQMCIE